jgi:DNA processing protein
MSRDEILPWLRLCRADLPARRVVALLERYRSPDALLARPASELCAAGGLLPAMAERLAEAATAECATELAVIERLGVTVLPFTDESYPARLKEIADPPPVLFLRGALQPRDAAAVAVVGTRRPTSYGKQIAERFGRELAEAGLTVVSGLARGIDTAVHRGALAAGGRTLAVLGSGVDVLYPPENARLATQVAEAGALLSESPIGAPPDAWRFPARNRIISGLSLGVLVVEAGERSGALVTAGLAGEQGREIFAIPNSLGNPQGRGTHGLIKDGAKLVESLEDILDELRVPGPRPAPAQLVMPELSLDLPEARLLELLSVLPRPMDDLIAESGLDSGQAAAALTLLELKGLARKTPGSGYVRVVSR